ncbi:MAG TPA: hypothetical protein VN519_13170 [Bryobacteraceae bacterium]|nr:hypothetical protein [Bryobacteraceae bacterium]
MATPKPLKRPSKTGSNAKSEPPTPRAEPGSFVIQGNAWYDEYGEMVIDEDGQIPPFIECELEQYGDFLYDEGDFRNDGKPLARAVPLYELKWYPIARKPGSRSIVDLTQNGSHLKR